MKEGNLVVVFDSELSVVLPAEWRYKHYTPEEVDADVQRVVGALGGSWSYLEEEIENV